jgi:hypothetical protein
LATTTYSSLRYPLSTNTPNVNQDIQNLASDVDQKITLLVANATARNALTNKYDGQRVYEQSTKRYYRWDATATAWVYAGGAPPPIVACTINAAYTAGTGLAPGCYKDASGQVCVIGGVVNGGGYTPSGNVMFTLPTGFWPTRDIAVLVMNATGWAIGGVYAADGTVKVNVGPALGPSTLHTVNFSFHPQFAGGALS